MAYELKTKKNEASVEEFLNAVQHDQKRSDSFELLALMREITGDEGTMWGPTIVGFGRSSYTYANGKKNEWFQTGFSPRKQSLTLYIMPGFDRYEQLLERLGKHKTGKSCLYVNKLSDIDMDVLRELVQESVKVMAESSAD